MTYTIMVPDPRWLPRKVKKAWRKLMDGRRALSAREWRIVDGLAHRRRSRVKYLRYPVTIGSTVER